EKNQVYENTLKFIDERIALLTDELSDVEGNVEKYKSRFNLISMTVEGELLLTQWSEYSAQISSLDVQLEILNTIYQFLLKDSDNFEFVPTNLLLNNLTLTNLLATFNNVLEEREKLAVTVGENHPLILTAQKQLANLRATII